MTPEYQDGDTGCELLHPNHGLLLLDSGRFVEHGLVSTASRRFQGSLCASQRRKARGIVNELHLSLDYALRGQESLILIPVPNASNTPRPLPPFCFDFVAAALSTIVVGLT
mmetsp:Transcript_14021/g.28966  ORF Transcript_14021/g.28966 Transcript_14021/m.28966 type:complete len:111 (+) Transcript_14021:262-594(+)